MKIIELTVSELFSEKYGNDVFLRCKKLNEEMAELNAAIENYKNATDPRDRDEKAVFVRDELSDVQAVLTHLSILFDSTHEGLLLEAIVKNKVREFYPLFRKENHERNII